MHLVANWQRVLRYAWSVRLIVLAALLSGVEFAFDAFVDEPPLPRGLFAALGALVTIAAAVARFVAQRKVSG